MRMPYKSRRVCDFELVFVVAFAVVLPKACLSFLAEPFAERPGAVKGAFCAAQRTLDGEDRSATLSLGKEGSPICGMLLVRSNAVPQSFFSRYYNYCRHPSIRTLDERLSLGASWVFSFQSVLPPDFRPLLPSLRGKLGQAIDAVTETRRLNFGLLTLCF